MYHKSSYLLTFAAALILGACSSTPQRVDILEEARMSVEVVDSHPDAERVAGHELASAKTALRNAEDLYDNRGDYEDVYHQSYKALRHAEIASERIAEAETREEIERSEEERTRVRLMAREAETQRALERAEDREREAASARFAADLKAREAEEARMQAAANAAEAERREREAEMAQDRAEAAIAEQRRLESALAELEAEKTERGYVLTLGDILFDTDKATLKPGALNTIDQVTAFLNEYPDRKLLIEGHADARGAESYNLQLSESRASSVRLALIDRGIDPGRLQVRGLGEDYPVASNDTSAGQQENRRVEIVFSDDEGSFPSVAMRSVANH